MVKSKKKIFLIIHQCSFHVLFFLFYYFFHRIDTHLCAEKTGPGWQEGQEPKPTTKMELPPLLPARRMQITLTAAEQRIFDAVKIEASAKMSREIGGGQTCGDTVTVAALLTSAISSNVGSHNLDDNKTFVRDLLHESVLLSALAD